MSDKGKQISIISLIIVIIITSFSYLQFNDYANSRSKFHNMSIQKTEV